MLWLVSCHKPDWCGYYDFLQNFKCTRNIATSKCIHHTCLLLSAAQFRGQLSRTCVESHCLRQKSICTCVASWAILWPAETSWHVKQNVTESRMIFSAYVNSEIQWYYITYINKHVLNLTDIKFLFSCQWFENKWLCILVIMTEISQKKKKFKMTKKPNILQFSNLRNDI
jgi:hypothetical protein